MDDATRTVFEALCAHIKAKGADATMTRVALRETAKLSEEALRDVLIGVCGPKYDQNLRVQFVDGDKDKITLGLRWLQDCGAK
jgi:hypothetical protein